MAGRYSAFVFTGGHRTPPTSLFDQEGFVLPQAGPHQRVALFSGGLDSLSGAVDTLATTDASLVLVSHHAQPGTKQVQRKLAQALDARFPGRAALYGFECTLSGVRAAEETQRSRSFLYCATGFAIARAYQTNALTIYENGVTSLNLRRREDLANASLIEDRPAYPQESCEPYRMTPSPASHRSCQPLDSIDDCRDHELKGPVD